MRQQASNNSSAGESLRRARKIAPAGKGGRAPAKEDGCGRPQHSSPHTTSEGLSTVTGTLAQRIGVRWMEHVKTSRWPKTADPQLPPPELSEAGDGSHDLAKSLKQQPLIPRCLRFHNHLTPSKERPGQRFSTCESRPLGRTDDLFHSDHLRPSATQLFTL